MEKILFLFLLLILPVHVLAGEIGDNIEYAGYLKTEVWIKNYNDEAHLSLSAFKNTFDVGMEYKFSDNWAFFFHPRYFYDAAYDIRTDYNSNFDRNQHKMGHVQRTEWLRDCYLDYTSDQLDIRLGKQQVVWTQADGLPFLWDRVMPFDLTFFWLPDFADIRIPLWMAKIEYAPRLNSTLQFLVIPDFEASRSAPVQAPFALKSNNDFDAWIKSQEALGRAVHTDLYRPAKKFKNTRVGLRWRSMVGDLEYTLNWLYGYTTGAYTYSEGTKIIGGNLHYYFSRRHKLVHLLGGSFNKSIVNPGLFEGVTFRGEFVYVHDEPTYYGTVGSRKATERSDKYNWFLGLDKTLFTNWVFSTQFAQLIAEDKDWNGYDIMSGYTYGLMDKVESVLTLKVATNFMHDRLKPEVLVIYSDDNDGRICFKTKYEVKDNLWLTLGYYHFWGPPYGSNGEFRNNDHVLCELKYTF
ncbi:MAG: hypothetical protein ISS45_08260 [Candidatus Omnitrophica bacterium]|nr:hypothetical protein [Candidatus Omnitrophota bacterium]